MSERIKIIFKNFELDAELNQTQTAMKIFSSLPFESKINRWGKEIYFKIKLKLGLEKDAREDVESGEIAYWPEGACFCIFFGPTPISKDKKPRAYSKVNVIGRLINFDPEMLDCVSEGEIVKVERIG